MENSVISKVQKEYWSERYTENRTGWDIGNISTPLKAYIDQLKNKNLRILIPGAGNAHEAKYLFDKGFEQVYVLDIAAAPLKAFQEKVPDFPSNQIIEGNFFEHQGNYDLILEQTFFCSFPPTLSNRNQYVEKVHELLAPQGKLVGLWFDIPLKGDMERRPFGGTKNQYLEYLSPLFEVKSFESCYNSIAPRKGSELFGIFQKK
jgi:SAM-dependent methyltransferase